MKTLARRILESFQESKGILTFYGEGFRDSSGRFLVKKDDNEFYSFSESEINV